MQETLREEMRGLQQGGGRTSVGGTGHRAQDLLHLKSALLKTRSSSDSARCSDSSLLSASPPSACCPQRA